MRLPRMMTRLFGNQGTRRSSVIANSAMVAAVILLVLAPLGFLDFRHYQPSRGTATLDQLVDSLPMTLKFAMVEQEGRSYVVWIGRPRGVTVSGPPVYVFDSTGKLVDRVYDAGESENKFVLDLYVAAFHAQGITPQEALRYCRGERAAVP